MIPIIKGHATYKDVFINRIYGIEDFDIFWQMINYKMVMDTWSIIDGDKK
jgi:hypothetical protein